MEPGAALRQAFDAMMVELGDELEPEPESFEDAIRSFGGPDDRTATRRMAEAMGHPPVSRPRQGADPERFVAWRAYQSALRQAQRWRAEVFEGAGQRRTARGANLNRLIAAASTRMGALLDAILERGLYVTHIAATFYIPSPVKRRDYERERIVSVVVYLEPDQCEPIVDAARAGDWAQAAEEFAFAYGQSYGIGQTLLFADIDELDISLGPEG